MSGDHKVTYDGVNLSPCCERGMTDYVFDISPVDTLGPATPAPPGRTERKVSIRGVLHYVAVAFWTVAAGLVLVGVGMVLEASLGVLS